MMGECLKEIRDYAGASGILMTQPPGMHHLASGQRKPLIKRFTATKKLADPNKLIVSKNVGMIG